MSKRKPLTFALVPDPVGRPCEPLSIIQTLANAGQMPRLTSRWGRRGGDCHEMAAAIKVDLFRAGLSRKEWVWCVGDCWNGPHSWIECDGWAIDASVGKLRSIMVCRTDLYRQQMEATGVYEGPPAWRKAREKGMKS